MTSKLDASALKQNGSWGNLDTFFQIRNFALGLGAGLFGLSVDRIVGDVIESVDKGTGLSDYWESSWEPSASSPSKMHSASAAALAIKNKEKEGSLADEETSSEVSEQSPAEQAKLLAELEEELGPQLDKSRRMATEIVKAHSAQKVAAPSKMIPTLKIPESGCHTALMDANDEVSSFQGGLSEKMGSIKNGAQIYWIGTNPGTATTSRATSPKATPRGTILLTPKRRPTSVQTTARSELKWSEAPSSSRVPPTQLPRRLSACWPPPRPTGNSPVVPMPREDAFATEKFTGVSVLTSCSPGQNFADPYEARKDAMRAMSDKAKEEDAFTEVQLRRRPGTLDIWNGSPSMPQRFSHGSPPQRCHADAFPVLGRVEEDDPEMTLSAKPLSQLPPKLAIVSTALPRLNMVPDPSEEYSLLRMLSARRRHTKAEVVVENSFKAHPTVKMAETLEAWSFPSLGIFDSGSKSDKAFSLQVQDLAHQLDTEVRLSRELAFAAAAKEKDVAEKERQVALERQRVQEERARVEELLAEIEMERCRSAQHAADLSSSLNCQQEKESVLRKKQESLDASISQLLDRQNCENLAHHCFRAWSVVVQVRHTQDKIDAHISSMSQVLDRQACQQFAQQCFQSWCGATQKRQLRKRDLAAKQQRQVLSQMLRIMEDDGELSRSKSTRTTIKSRDGSFFVSMSADSPACEDRQPEDKDGSSISSGDGE